MYVCICMYVCMYVCTYVRMYVCICMCVSKWLIVILIDFVVSMYIRIVHLLACISQLVSMETSPMAPYRTIRCHKECTYTSIVCVRLG